MNEPIQRPGSLKRRKDVRARISHSVARDKSIRPQQRPFCEVRSRRGRIFLKGEHAHGGVCEVLEVEVGVDSDKTVRSDRDTGNY